MPVPVLVTRVAFRVLVSSLCLALATPLGAAGIAVGELSLGVWSPFATRWEVEAPVCIRSTVAGERFRVVATGGDVDAFAMRAGTEATIPYRLWWHRRDGSGQHEEPRPGRRSQHAIAADDSPDCGGDANSRLRVRVRGGDMDAAPPGVYRDTLRVILVPL